MKNLLSFFLVPGTILFLSIMGCKSSPEIEVAKVQIQEKKIFEVDGVTADNRYDGAHLHGFKKIGDSKYQALILPENEPINQSTWFSFKLKSNEPRQINLELYYPDYKHRYVPKISHDGTTWTPIDSVTISENKEKATFQIQLSNQPTWVSAQEIYDSKSIATWGDSICQFDFCNKKEIGKSVLGRQIHSYEINETKEKQTLVLVGRQHPPEIPGGTISMLAFVETVLSNTTLAQEFRQQFKILILPLLNPDGVDLGFWRHNANGKDMNRDWIDFTEPETQAVRDYLYDKRKADSLDYRFGIDFHTSFSGPYLLVLDSMRVEATPGIITQWTHNIEKVAPDLHFDWRHRSQELPYCYNWFVNSLKMEAVTYEEGDEIDRALIRRRATIYAEELMKVLMQ